MLVIFGLNLRFDFDQRDWVGHPECSCDTIVKRSRTDFTALAKNTYRVLLSRVLKGCYLCFS